MLFRCCCIFLTIASLAFQVLESAQQREKNARSKNPLILPFAPTVQEKVRNPDSEEAFIILKKTETAFHTSNLSTLQPMFAGRVYVSFFTGENGYFSSNQTYFILKKFFEDYHVISFSFQTINSESVNPYGVGQYFYLYRGIKNSVQLYLSLHRSDGGWKINQITLSQRQ